MFKSTDFVGNFDHLCGPLFRSCRDKERLFANVLISGFVLIALETLESSVWGLVRVWGELERAAPETALRICAAAQACCSIS